MSPLSYAEMMFSVYCYREEAAIWPWSAWYFKRKRNHWFRVMNAIIKESQGK